jgi:hypothetical protein
MAERSISLPLSMGEVGEAICVKIKEALRRDCNFNSDLACDWFKAHVAIKVEHSDIGRVIKSEHVVSSESGEKPADPADVYLDELELDIEKAAPNQVRMDTEQPLPIAVTDKNGHTDIKRVTYKRPGTFLPETK